MTGGRSYSDAALQEAAAVGRTMSEILSLLDLAPSGGNYETVRRRISALGFATPNLRIRQRGRSLECCSDAEITEVVNDSRSLAQVLVALGVRPGGNQSRLKERIARMRVDTSHFVGRGWRTGATIPAKPRRPLSELLRSGQVVQTHSLKKRLISEGIKQARCDRCFRDMWNGEPIPLELDHINGQRDDNRLENLRVLCPNCHAQTETYRGRNIGSATTYSDVASPGWRNLRQPRQA
jgi:hypothetical protein